MDDAEQHELVRKLFALLTMKFEDAAGIAADGQGAGVSTADQHSLAEKLVAAASEVSTIAEAILAILPVR